MPTGFRFKVLACKSPRRDVVRDGCVMIRDRLTWSCAPGLVAARHTCFLCMVVIRWDGARNNIGQYSTSYSSVQHCLSSVRRHKHTRETCIAAGGKGWNMIGWSSHRPRTGRSLTLRLNAARADRTSLSIWPRSLSRLAAHENSSPLCVAMTPRGKWIHPKC